MKFSEVLKEYLELRSKDAPRYSAIRGEEDYSLRQKEYYAQLTSLEQKMDEITGAAHVHENRKLEGYVTTGSDGFTVFSEKPFDSRCVWKSVYSGDETCVGQS